MDDLALARFLREELPGIKRIILKGDTRPIFFDALTALVALVREAKQKLVREWWIAHRDRCLHESGLCTGPDCQFHPQPEVLARLRAILPGEQ